MKLIAFFMSFAFSVSALAGKSEVSVNSINFDGQNLSFEYATGGGCAEHTTEVDVEFAPKSNQAIVKIYDVTDKPDFCEAMLYLTGSVDLKSLVQEKAQEKGLSGNYFDLVLPAASISLY